MTCELVLIGDNVFTGADDVPVLAAVGVKGGRIVKVCPPRDIEPMIGADTEVLRYGDALILPGFFDGHEHAFLGGIFDRSVDLGDCRSEEEAAKKVEAFASDHPELSWIVGTGWYDVLWKPKRAPDKRSLDRLLPDTPVYLINSEGHSAWINTKAIEASGIGEHREFGEEIPRDESGEPTGHISEAAMLVVARLAFDMPAEVQRVILREFLDRTARLGITAVSNIQCYQGSDIDLGNIEVLREFDENGELTTRFFPAVGLTGDLERPRRLRDRLRSPKLKFSGLKHLIDGTATGHTAFMIEPYADRPGSVGSTRIPPEELRRRILDADKEGFRVRLHACGDGSVRLGLDCFEAARKRNGKRDARHTIEHIEILRESDIPRFARLGVVASMQPAHLAMCEDFKDNPYPAILGKERERLTWPIKSLLDGGAAVQFGTDYPIVDNNPMIGVYRAVTRAFDKGSPAGGWNPQERITLAQALRCYTYGSAYGAFMENDLGTLEEGKLADIVVLGRNLFALDPKEYLDVKPLLTVMDGRVVYRA